MVAARAPAPHLRALIGVLAGLWLVACVDANARSSVEDSGAGAARPILRRDPDAGMAVEVPAVSARCRLVGASQVEREDTFMDIASDYFVAVSESCQTSILVSALTLDQQIDWFGYILKYTTVLFECETDPSPLIGGIGAFGPGNTEPVAGPSAPLGVDDAARLIDIFLGVCTDYVALPPDELEALRAHLEQAALQIVDPNVGSRLGSCDSATDAGADGGDD